jgi:hypothetical protein
MGPLQHGTLLGVRQIMRASDFGTTLPGIAVPGYGPRFGESIENDGSYNFWLWILGTEMKHGECEFVFVRSLWFLLPSQLTESLKNWNLSNY